ncbi:MAG TPA: hypothetical protein VIR31_05905 [Nitrososphaeraceae archaeon]
MKKEIIVCDDCRRNERISTCSICEKDVCDKCGVEFTDFEHCNIYFCRTCTEKVTTLFVNSKYSKQVRQNLIKVLVEQLALLEL